MYNHIYVVRAQCVAGKFLKLLWGKDKIQAALERLDRLTNVEGLSVAAQTMGVVHNLADNIKVVVGGAPYFFFDSRGYLSKRLFH